MTMMRTRIIRIQGVPVRVPAGLFTQPSTGDDLWCPAREPCWPNGQGGQVICCLPVHATGPDGVTHIANDAGWPDGNVIAIWWDAQAVPSADDED